MQRVGLKTEARTNCIIIVQIKKLNMLNLRAYVELALRKTLLVEVFGDCLKENVNSQS